MKIGFVGYSRKEFDEIRAEVITLRIFNEIHSKRDENEQIEIVFGATNIGIHKIIYKMAKLCNYKTVGVMCSKGYDKDLLPVDKLIVVGETWGDESKIFIEYIDKLYRLGGGTQSKKEAEMAKAKGIKVVEFDL